MLMDLTFKQKLHLASEITRQALILIKLAESGKYPNFTISHCDKDGKDGGELQIEYDYDHNAIRILGLYMNADWLSFTPQFIIEKPQITDLENPIICLYRPKEIGDIPLISLASGGISEQFEIWLANPPAHSDFNKWQLPY